MRVAIPLVLALFAGCLAAPPEPPTPGPAASAVECATLCAAPPDPGVLNLTCAVCKVPIDVTPGGGWEPHVAVHPRDPDHVVAVSRAVGPSDAAGASLRFDLHVSRDGGRTWNATPVVPRTTPLMDTDERSTASSAAPSPS